MVFHWSLSDSKSPQVFRTLLSILAVLNNAVVWMVSTRPPTSKSSSPFNNPLGTVPKEPIIIGIIVTFIFHSFFSSLAKSRYSSFSSHSFSFILGLAGTAKLTIFQILFLFCLLLGLIFWSRLGDLSVCQSPIGVYVCHFLGQYYYGKLNRYKSSLFYFSFIWWSTRWEKDSYQSPVSYLSTQLKIYIYISYSLSLSLSLSLSTHTHARAHTHTYIYIYINARLCVDDYRDIYSPHRVGFSGEEVIVLPLAFIASLFLFELRSRQPLNGCM